MERVLSGRAPFFVPCWRKHGQSRPQQHQGVFHVSA
nr:MAG TPA: hypothetical protein [Caudoviricetes sp.]